MKYRYFYSMLQTLMLYCASISAETVNVALEPREQFKRDEYLTTLLQQAILASQYPAKINLVTAHPHQQRALISIENSNIDVYWSMTSPERETLAIAVKFPIYQGYIGKRALLTRKELLPLFAKITNVEQLKKFNAAQGHDWPDTKILAYNGLPVRALSNYESMFSLTASGKVDYFPRSFIEVTSELDAHQQSNLVIVPNLYISYPAKFYYFVSKEKPELAKAIENGLIKMQQSGEFQTLFAKYFAKDLKALPYDKEKTRELKLTNPYFKQ